MRRISILLLVFSLLTFVESARAQVVSTFASVPGAPRGLTEDGSGNLYVSLRYNSSKIVKFMLPSNTPIVYSASGFVDPIDMVFDDSGNLFVADFDNGGAAGKIVKIPPGGGPGATFVSLANPGALTRDAAGNLYAGEYFTQRIVKITPAGVPSTYVTSIGVAMSRLVMLYLDTDGTLYAGTLDGFIYKVGPGGSPITTWATGLTSVDGFAPNASGWWATTYLHDTIIQITSVGAASLYAGAPSTAGFTNGPLLSARFYYAAGILQINDTVYIADYGNAAVRAIGQVPTSARSGSWGRLKALYR
jgi:hypothetical protein